MRWLRELTALLILLALALPCGSAQAQAVPGGTPAGAAGAWQNISPAGVSTDFNNPPSNYGFQAIAVDPQHPGVVYVGTCNQGIWRSADAGSTWSRIDTAAGGATLDGRIWSLSVDPFNPSTLYAANGYGSDEGLFKSADGGVTWKQMLPPSVLQQAGPDVAQINVDPYQPNHLIASWHGAWTGTGDAGVAESRDGGQTWTLHPPQPGWGSEAGGVFFMDNSTTWLLANRAGLWKTTDGGNSWKQVSTAASQASNLYRSATGAWYIGATGSVLRSTDDGETWTAVLNGGGQVFFAVIGDGTTLYAQPALTGSNAALAPYFSSPEADGTQWSPLSQQVFTDGPMSMAYDPTAHVVYSSNWDAGVWRLPTGSLQPPPATGGPPVATAPLPSAPVAAAPMAAMPQDGTYIVGRDIQPGAYATTGGNGCYWARLSTTDIADGQIIYSAYAPRGSLVIIRPTDAAFFTEGCAPWFGPGVPPGSGTAG